MRMGSVLKHSAQAVAEGALIALLVVGLAAGTTFAAKPTSGGGGGGHKGGGGGGTTSGSSSLVLVLSTDQNGDGLVNYADTITWTVSTTATLYPYVQVLCYQNGGLVYSASAGFYASYPWPGSQYMPLYSPAWTGGAASCTATLNDTLATVSFAVGS
jgi:hypothetical protein